MDMLDGKVDGYFVVGENPAVGNGARQAAPARDERSSNGWWSGTSSIIESGHLLEGRAQRSPPASCVTADIDTEVFFFPAAAHTEKDGTFTQTQRHAAVAPQGRRAARRLRGATCTSSSTLGRKIMRERLPASTRMSAIPTAPGI